MNDTESPIEIYIPSGRNATSDAVPFSFVNPGNGTMAYHSFEIKNNDTAFSLRIEPANETILAVYVRYGRRPDETNYDYKFLIPDFSSCLPPGDMNCTMVSEFMQCVGRGNVTYKSVNFTKPGLPKSCGPPHDGTVTPPPAPPGTTFKCPDVCKYENYTYPNCSCDEIPDMTFLFNSTMADNSHMCKTFIDFQICENDTLLCKNTVNLLSCYVLQLESYKQCRSMFTIPQLFYGMYEKCLKDPFRVFYNSSVGKAGKWYVGVQVYVPPNDTTTEEEGGMEEVEESVEGILNYDLFLRKITNMTNETEVKVFVEKYVVDYVNHYRRLRGKGNVTLEDDHCYWPRWFCHCEKQVRRIMNRWSGNHKWKKEDDKKRKRRSLASDENADRLCVVVKEKSPPPKIGEIMTLVEEHERDLNGSTLYKFDVALYTCLFWDKSKDEWSTAGCTVGFDNFIL